jgi:GT2 family glycosyltransferase
VNYDGKHHLEHCLPALQAQTLQPDEILVVDNGSTDDSLDYLRTCHHDVRVIALRENLGFAGGNAVGYQAATGDYIVLLNNDTWPLPAWLERLAECAESHAEVGIVASHMTDWDGDYTDSAGDGCTVTGRGFKLRHGSSTSQPVTSSYVFSACAGASLYKRAMLEDIGFFDPHFFMNAEDTDLAFRAQLAGWKAYLCSDAVVRHRIGGSQQIYSWRHVFYSTRNHHWLYLRCMPGRLMAKHAPAYLAHSFLYFLFFLHRRRLGAHLAGLFAALVGVPRVLAQRRKIRALRRVRVSEIERQLHPLPRYLSLKMRAAPR